MTPDDPRVRQVLGVLLRVRPGTVGELRRVRGLPAGDLDEVLALLRAEGHLDLDGDTITVHPPQQALEQRAAELAARTAALPELLRQWHSGTTAPELDVEVVHGHQAQWEAWSRYAALRPPRAPLNLYPGLEVLRDVILPDLPAALAAHTGVRPRAVIPASAVVTADDRDVVHRLEEAGLGVRLAKHVDSWVYADHGVLSALPLTWAEHPPASIMIVCDPAITAVVSAYAELVWATAQPYDHPRQEWADVLRLLGLGMSDAAIATAGESSLRTVQRRIADAMTHYGVTSRFELGAAWAQEVEAEVSGTGS